MKIDSVLSEIFFLENEYNTCDEKYDHSSAQLADNDELVTAALKDDPALLEKYNAVNAAHDEYEAIAVKEFYALGFKSGFKLALEIFDVKLPDYYK